MNKKGQVGIGILITTAIAIILGLVLLLPISTNVEQATRTETGVITARNTTITGTAGTTYELTGQELVTTLGVTNQSGGGVIPTTNYTLVECVRTSDNLKGICYRALTGPWSGLGINVSYTYYPNGYIDDAGGRSIAAIIILLTAVVIALLIIPHIRKEFD